MLELALAELRRDMHAKFATQGSRLARVERGYAKRLESVRGVPGCRAGPPADPRRERGWVRPGPRGYSQHKQESHGGLPHHQTPF